jgi:hypothetical protein
LFVHTGYCDVGSCDYNTDIVDLSIEQNKKIEQLEGVVKSYQTLFEKVEKLESEINQ